MAKHEVKATPLSYMQEQLPIYPLPVSASHLMEEGNLSLANKKEPTNQITQVRRQQE